MFPEKTMTDNGIRIKDWDQEIYRIFSKSRFIELLDTKKNGLVHPSLWDDPMENFFFQCIAVNKEGEHISLKEISRSWFGQCWTTNVESDAMWRIYSHDKSGVKVKTTIRKLFASIYDEKDDYRGLKYFIGEVEYQSKEEIENFLSNTSFTDLAFGGQAYKFANTFFTKRLEFLHEKEVRILFYDTEKKYYGQDVAHFNFLYEILLDEVIIDPRMTTSEFEATKAEFKKHGCNINITQSELYRVDLQTIKL